MDATLDFTRWTEKPRGIAYRRWVITSTGLRQLFRTKFFRILLFLAWLAGVALAVFGFFFSQSIAPGGWLEQFAASINPRAEAVVAAFCGYVLLYPDVVIQGLYTAVFWAQAGIGLFLSLIALTVVVPSLVTRDRAGDALTIYLARPLTSFDYLVGKFGIIVGILLAVWTGPLLFGWLLSMLFAPDSTFVVYSLLPLGRALLFNLAGLIVLASIAMGISAATKTTAYTILLWLGAWIALGAIGKIPIAPEWLRSLSFTHDLDVLRLEIFRPAEVLSKVVNMIPLLDARAVDNIRHVSSQLHPGEVGTTIIGLAVLVAVSSIVFFRRLRPA